MSYQVLARKWRPKRFQDVIGQAHITRSLQNAIIRNELGHAYILTGTRGIGKTSVARLFAKSVRCENLTEDANPCHNCASCQDFDSGSSMNVIEIDGASNNSVDNVRDLIGNVQYAPTMGRYKVYIIDEVHMLSNQAFNALLKTLEEPPAHVIFIMATTEPQKLLGTVLSRCQRFDFRNASVSDLTALILRIAEHEGISFSNERIVRQISREGKGSVRDTLSLLDQVLTYCEGKKIDDESLALSLGLANASAIRKILEAIFKAQPSVVSETIDTLMTQNVSIVKLAYAVLDHLYEIIQNIDSASALETQDLIDPKCLEDISSSELFWIYETMAKDMTWALDSLDPHRVTDICFQKLSLRREFYSADARPALKKKDESLKEAKKEPEPVVEQPHEQEEVKPEEQATPKQESTPIPQEEKPQPKTEFSKTWEGFLSHIKSLSPAAATNLEQGNLTFPLHVDEKTVRLQLGFSQDDRVFYDHLSEPESLNKLKEQLANFFKVEKNFVDFQLTLLDQKEKEEAGFMSMAELKTRDENALLEKRKADFIASPIIQEAQNLFKSKIDKIVFEKK